MYSIRGSWKPTNSYFLQQSEQTTCMHTKSKCSRKAHKLLLWHCNNTCKTQSVTVMMRRKTGLGCPTVHFKTHPQSIVSIPLGFQSSCIEGARLRFPTKNLFSWPACLPACLKVLYDSQLKFVCNVNSGCTIWHHAYAFEICACAGPLSWHFPRAPSLSLSSGFCSEESTAMPDDVP